MATDQGGGGEAAATGGGGGGAIGTSGLGFGLLDGVDTSTLGWDDSTFGQAIEQLNEVWQRQRSLGTRLAAAECKLALWR